MSLLKDRKGKQYWRSLDELAETPEFKEFLHREFPQGASEMTNPVTRRTFLRLMGASTALAGLASCRRPVEKIIPYVKAPEDVIPGVPKYYASTMPLGAGACGILVESHEGRPTKIEGNPNHPSSLGASNSFQQAEILNLYDPDRPAQIMNGEYEKEWIDFVEYWQDVYSEFQSEQGHGLAVLMEEFSSPTLARLQRDFQQAFPQAKWVTYSPVSDENIFEGVRAATGAAAQPVHHFDKADVVLSLDADFFLGESNDIANSKGFSQKRRVESETDEMNRLYVVESTYTITGAMSDHRLPLQGRQIEAFTAALAVELRGQDLNLPIADTLNKFASHNLGDEASKWISAVAKDLRRARGKSIVVAGRRQSASIHALVYAINEALGNNGATISYFQLQDKSTSSRGAMTALATEMNSGTISTLVILGGNPVYDSPADLGFSGALKNVETVIHLSMNKNETFVNATWSIPGTHFLEAWGDARAANGAMSVVQPLIAPLFASHSQVELLNLLVNETDLPGHEIVRETWQAAMDFGSTEIEWRRVLHDGILADSELPATDAPVDGLALKRHLDSNPISSDAATKDNLEIAFTASNSTFDGRCANNGWMQELPDPITKITWDNTALISMKLAKELSLKNGDLVNLGYKDRVLEAPVWILPGQADYSVAIELGFGREIAGRVGDKVGFNAYKLRTADAQDYGRGLQMTLTGGTHNLVSTQDHFALDTVDESRHIYRHASLAEYKDNPDFATEADEFPHLDSIKHENGRYQTSWDEHKYDTGYQWGMTIDLNSCTGCNACTTACQSENNIPVVGKDEVDNGREMHWIRLDRYFEGEGFDNPRMVYQPVACQQCEMAPCEQVCPVAATVHDAEGLNSMVYNRCIGTRYCANNCPYKVRRFNFYNYTKDTPEIVKMANNPNVTVRFRGVMEKCTYCIQRINTGKYAAKKSGKPLEDGAIRTACEQTCPTDAIVFGDINNPASQVSKIKQQNKNYEMLSELNLRTRTTFLAKLRNPNPELDESV